MALTAGNWREVAVWDLPNDVILHYFQEESGHDTGRTAKAYRGRIAAALRRFRRRHGYEPRLLEALTDVSLLSLILAGDESLVGERRISKETVIGTRSAFGAFIAVMPPPEGHTRAEVRELLTQARRATSTIRGLRLITGPGVSSRRDNKPIPTGQEIDLVIASLRRMISPWADLTADLVGFCYLTGIRVGAALDIRAADLEKHPDGSVWAYVHEKARPDRRPLLLRSSRPEPPRVWMLLSADTYIFSYGGQRLTYARASRLLHEACMLASVRPFSFHRLRHAFVSHALPAVGMRVVMQAGGWVAEPVLQTYYHRRTE